MSCTVKQEQRDDVAYIYLINRNITFEQKNHHKLYVKYIATTNI